MDKEKEATSEIKIKKMGVIRLFFFYFSIIVFMLSVLLVMQNLGFKDFWEATLLWQVIALIFGIIAFFLSRRLKPSTRKIIISICAFILALNLIYVLATQDNVDTMNLKQSQGNQTSQ